MAGSEWRLSTILLKNSVSSRCSQYWYPRNLFCHCLLRYWALTRIDLSRINRRPTFTTVSTRCGLLLAPQGKSLKGHGPAFLPVPPRVRFGSNPGASRQSLEWPLSAQRRNCVIAVRPTEGPLTDPRADTRHSRENCSHTDHLTVFVDVTVYAPAKPPDGQLDGGEGDKGREVSARLSKSLAKCRFRPNQENVRSTATARAAAGAGGGRDAKKHA
jgi:hypothetical protein